MTRIMTASTVRAMLAGAVLAGVAAARTASAIVTATRIRW